MAENKSSQEKLLKAYHGMTDNMKVVLQELEHLSEEKLEALYEKSETEIKHLYEISSEEASLVAAHLKRDINDAAHYLTETGKELNDWIGMDTQLVEDKLKESFNLIVDKTQLALLNLKLTARTESTYKTGEIVGVGVLVCAGCTHELHFEKPGHIPPCPHCAGTHFKRIHTTT